MKFREYTLVGFVGLVAVATGLGAAGPVAAQPGGCEDEILIRIIEGSVLISHNGSEYNCCPESFDYRVEAGAGQIVVTETEILEVPCDCVCCFDLGARIVDVPPGAYTLVFRWFDYGVDLWVERSVEIVIPDEGQGEDPAVAGVERSDCYWGVTEVPPVIGQWPENETETETETGAGEPPGADVGTWGMVKGLYR